MLFFSKPISFLLSGYNSTNVIADFATEKPGKIQSIILYDYETQKGKKMKRIKQILA